MPLGYSLILTPTLYYKITNYKFMYSLKDIPKNNCFLKTCGDALFISLTLFPGNFLKRVEQ